MSVLRALHRADEALIIVEPTDAAVGDALHDALSLEGSAIGNRERLIDIVRIAMHRLSPGSAVSFMAAVTGAPANDAERINENQAREALREVRHALNEFRDDRHEGLIRARNRLVWTMLAVGVTTYLLLSLALVAGVSVKYIQTAAILYLVGAIVGLFNRLRIEAGQSSAVEDFGLSQARLVVTPLVSGLAAVAGVYLIAALPVLLPNGSDPPATAPVLSEVFDLATNSMALVYAAIFGLAPSTLTSRLIDGLGAARKGPPVDRGSESRHGREMTRGASDDQRARAELRPDPARLPFLQLVAAEPDPLVQAGQRRDPQHRRRGQRPVRRDVVHDPRHARVRGHPAARRDPAAGRQRPLRLHRLAPDRQLRERRGPVALLQADGPRPAGQGTGLGRAPRPLRDRPPQPDVGHHQGRMAGHPEATSTAGSSPRSAWSRSSVAIRTCSATTTRSWATATTSTGRR